ncbi:MAG: DUF559 domain-containing protein [Solirubrobacterales bacterium]|nr:DUF559 domain-containing protein [Solirubrobacterales bacterium]
MEREIRIEGSRDHRSASRRAAELSRRQFGAIARRQLLEIGFSPTRVRDWLRCGRLHARYPGVYIWGRPDTGDEGNLAAALLYSGRSAALGGLTALWWLELLGHEPVRIHVDAPGRASSRPGLAIRHPRRVERRMHRHLPVVPLAEALLPAGESLSHNAMRLVLARADFERLLDLSALHTALADGRRGSRVVRAALGAHLPQLARCANGFEREFVLLCEAHHLPLPEPNPRIGRFRPDMLWREARLIVELDGSGAHSTAAQLAADGRRQAELERFGYTVARFSRAEVHYDPGGVMEAVRHHLI